jgi:hypothetical protein
MGKRVMEESLVGGLGRLRRENKPRVNEETGARGTGRVTLRYVREFHHTPRYFNIDINNCRLGIVT